MKIVITGGSGQVGSVTAQHLARDHEVTIFDIRPPKEPLDNVRFVNGDVLDTEQVRQVIRDHDAVVHLAIRTGSWTDDGIMLTNVMGTQRVVEAAVTAGAGRVVMASSMGAYGFLYCEGRVKPRYIPLDEEHPCTPADAYGLSKWLSEEICRRYTRSHGLQTVCLRLVGVFDDRMYSRMPLHLDAPEKYRESLWSYVDVRDVANLIGRALTTPDIEHETICVSAVDTAAAQPTLELMARFYPETEIRDAGLWADDPYRSLWNCSRAERVFGWRPTISWRNLAAATGKTQEAMR